MAKKNEPWHRQANLLLAGVLTLLIYIILYYATADMRDVVFYLNSIHALPFIGIILVLAGVYQMQTKAKEEQEKKEAEKRKEEA